MFPMFGNLYPPALPGVVDSTQSLVILDLRALAALAGAALVGLLAASAVRLVRRARRSADIRVATSTRMRRAA